MNHPNISRLLILTAGLLALAGSGCSTMSNTEKGAGIGAALGAGVGTAIGAATGNPKTGAVVGGLLGAGVGGAVGNEADQREKDQAEARAIETANARKMGLMDVVQMHASGVDSRVIVNQIRATGSTFNLSTADIQYLNDQRVPSDVIVAMQQSQAAVHTRGGRTVVVREPETVIYERPIYRPVYVAPPPVGFGVTYIRRW